MVAARSLRDGATNGARREEYGQAADERELKDFFQCYESKVGIRSLHFDSIYAIATVRSVRGLDEGPRGQRVALAGEREMTSLGDRASDLEMLDRGDLPPCRTSSRAIEESACVGWDNLAAIVPELTRAKRVYRNLKSLEDAGGARHVMVLWRLYGPGHPSSEFPVFKEFSTLAAYTDAADEAREAYAFLESERREERVRQHVEATIPKQTMRLLEEIEAEIDQQTKTVAECVARRVRNATRSGRYTEERTKQIARARPLTRKQGEKAARRALWLADLPRKALENDRLELAARGFLRRLERQREDLLRGEDDGILRARIGAIASADAEVTVADGIRWMLRDPPKDASPIDRAARHDERARFVSEVRVQAHRLKRDAHTAYSFAKRGG